MRSLTLTAQTATDPALGRFRRLNRGERARLFAYGSAADGVSVVAKLGDTELANGPIPLESAAGAQCASGGIRQPLFDIVATTEGELSIAFTPGGNTYDMVLEIDP